MKTRVSLRYFEKYCSLILTLGINIKKIPIMAKLPLDLFKLYNSVISHGGLAQVSLKSFC